MNLTPVLTLRKAALATVALTRCRRAAEVVLTSKEMQELDNALPHVSGPRYNEQQMAFIDR